MRPLFEGRLRSRQASQNTGRTGLDFAEAVELFEGPTFEAEDTRKDYGERRIICFGQLRGRLVVVRGRMRPVFSMRKANDREEARFGKRLGEG